VSAPAGNAERIDALERRLREASVPVAGAIELTRRCNLRCVHCYLGAERSAAPAAAGELGTAAWLRVVDELADAGCLDLVLTGGEPLLSPAFAAVYTRARRAGLLVTLFSNGTLVDGRTVALLLDLPPARVEVSIYGATAPTHDAVTGVPGSFAGSLAACGRLAAAGLPLTIKTVVMTANLAEFDAMERLALGLGARWRFDPAIFPRLDGDRSPLALRVPAAEAARLDVADGGRARQWRECYERGRSGAPSPRLYTCGAGTTNFHVDPRGVLLPCVMSRRPAVALEPDGFARAWRRLVGEVAALHAPAGYRCNSCEKRNICGLCPPFFELESGAAGAPPPYLCDLGDKRRERIYDLV
jgi:radical SAM protein with 4Fe4S-binding SPASM domain